MAAAAMTWASFGSEVYGVNLDINDWGGEGRILIVSELTVASRSVKLIPSFERWRTVSLITRPEVTSLIFSEAPASRIFREPPVGEARPERMTEASRKTVNDFIGAALLLGGELVGSNEAAELGGRESPKPG